MSDLGEEVHGTFTYKGAKFDAGYRSGGPLYHQGGYKKCLKLYNGVDSKGEKISGHEYFGDDKFGIKEVKNIDENTLKIIMEYPFRRLSEYRDLGVDEIFMKKNNKFTY